MRQYMGAGKEEEYTVTLVLQAEVSVNRMGLDHLLIGIGVSFVSPC